jgi:preprotein translocase subunit SecA
MYGRAQDKWLAVFKQVEKLHREGRPVLVGTCSVRDSELLAHLLRRRQLPYRILNARQDAEEAEVVANAGQRAQITLATNMAGRGTDIKLGAGVAESGGLHVICTECHEEARVDQQLFGRCARQGDPGSYERILSLNDALVRNCYPTAVRRWLGRSTASGRTLPGWLVQLVVSVAQRISSRRARQTRRDVARLDEQLGKMLAYSGKQE